MEESVQLTSFSERLAEVVARDGPLCVGIDPRLDMLPAAFRTSDPIRGFTDFCFKILELVRPYSGIVKPQSAFFELLGPAGFEVQLAVLARARELGFLTILDAKRGDIASTAEAYAQAAVNVWNADALTVNPYLGEDSIEPFLKINRNSTPARGLFVLVRTSNPGGGMFQNLDCGGMPLYRRVAAEVVRWNSSHGDVGAVVGATHPRELAELRAAMPGVWFLIPGYGAQGGSAADVKAGYWSNGLGAVVNSSRGVVFPYKPDDPQWEAKVTAAARQSQTELR